MQLRIMTFNVLNGWNTTQIGSRDDLAASVICSERPDVLCLQEFDPCYREAEQPLQELIAAHYTEVGDAHVSWNPIFYDHKILRPLAHGEVDFARGTSYNYPRGGTSRFRTVFYALLETLDGADRFLVLNLHYDMCKEEELRIANQADESRQAVALAGELMAKHGIDALFVTGDYNARIDGVPTTYMLENGFVDTHALANEADDRGSCSQLGKPLWGNYAHAIDHVLYLGSRPLTVHRYQTVDSIRDASDHAPVIVDLSLN